MADGTIFEHEGLQAASIVTAPFLKTADSMARRNGYPEYRYAVMPHPIGNLRRTRYASAPRRSCRTCSSILGVSEGVDGGK